MEFSGHPLVVQGLQQERCVRLSFNSLTRLIPNICIALIFRTSAAARAADAAGKIESRQSAACTQCHCGSGPLTPPTPSALLLAFLP